ncbi:hypothetical protein [Roseibacillus persicicus]|uniref:Uncharacterized protein n=1 Tax=Roseibacillus persicicus TaxID=454148 RepID=A0A918WJL9_9BACT|nr:hypothetical protein [Roseibacillus persicicus]GHC48911.1 hypothetical protein GCM10007100_13570 [Roseibacillus persicicus]
MSASPFRTTTESFIEAPVPVTPSSLQEMKKNLEDVPFEAGVHDFPTPEMAFERERDSEPFARSKNWFHKLFKGRAERRMREEQLAAELQDLRASYAGLLHSTEDIRDRFELETESRHNVAKALSPFPAAVAGIERLQTRQEEASEILTSIRERIGSTVERDQKMLTSMDAIHGGVNVVQSGVEKVNQAVAGLAENQMTAVASVGDLGSRMDAHFEKVAEAAKQNTERLEQSSDDVLTVLRQMERNSQRGLWIFATLLAVLFVALVCFSAKMSQLEATQTEIPSAGVATGTPSESESYAASDSDAQVLVDEFEF